MTDKSMFVSSLIDLDAWNAAGWSGVAFLYAPDLSMPPGMALIFRDQAAATRIFEGWRDRFGEADKHDELRVSIIEGDIPGEDSGYSVTIGSNVANVIARANANGQNLTPDYITTISRIHRMNPAPESKNLEMFKRSFEKYGYYGLMPAMADPKNAGNVEPLYDLVFTKRSVLFRRVEDVGENDIDRLIFKQGR